MRALPNNLAFLRNEKKLKQQQLADLLDVGRSTYANWESGQAIPPLDKLDRILKLHRVSYDQLLHVDLSTKRTSLLPEFKEEGVTYRRQNNLFVPAASYQEYVSRPGQAPPGSRYIDVPVMEGVLERTFEVGDEALASALRQGDLLLCSKVERLHEILDRSIYVLVVPSRGVLIRYVARKENNLVLETDRQAETVALGEVRELWLARCRITCHLDARADQGGMQGRIQRLESILADQFPQYFTS